MDKFYKKDHEYIFDESITIKELLNDIDEELTEGGTICPIPADPEYLTPSILELIKDISTNYVSIRQTIDAIPEIKDEPEIYQHELYERLMTFMFMRIELFNEQNSVEELIKFSRFINYLNHKTMIKCLIPIIIEVIQTNFTDETSYDRLCLYDGITDTYIYFEECEDYQKSICIGLLIDIRKQIYGINALIAKKRAINENPHSIDKCIEKMYGDRYILKEGLKTKDIIYQIPEHLQIVSIGYCAFSQCPNLKILRLSSTISLIAQSAFHNCHTISKVYGGQIKRVFDNAFTMCTNLKSINLSNCDRIGPFAFSQCKSLAGPLSLMNIKRIDNDAFSHCTSLTELNLRFITDQYYTTKISKKCFTTCIALKEITIDNCYVIQKQAFAHCKELSQITLKSVQRLERNCFQGCDSLKEISLPKSITHIKRDAFAFCRQLTHIKFEHTDADFNKLQLMMYNEGWFGRKQSHLNKMKITHLVDGNGTSHEIDYDIFRL